MAARKTRVGVEAVREYARQNKVEGKFTGEKARGRVPKALIEQYEAETGNVVEKGFKSAKTVTLSVTKVDAKGRKRTRKVEKTLAEVRALAGEAAGSRGVLSAKAREAAEAALSDPVETPESE